MNEHELLALLKSLDVEYEYHAHPAVFTCEEARDHARNIPGLHSKNLFLRNKKKDCYYLMSVQADKRVDIMRLAKMIGETKLSFASSEDLLEILQLTPGSVTPFGLVNDRENRVRFYLDRDLTVDRVGFHPNANTATLVIDMQNFSKFLVHTGHTRIEIDVPVREMSS